MYLLPQERGGMRALCWFVGLLLLGAVIAGVLLGSSELLSPSVHEAKVDALREKTEYTRLKHEIELEALQERRDRQLELMEPIAVVGLVVGAISGFTLTVAVSYYFVAKAKAEGGGQAPSKEGKSGASGGDQTRCRVPRANVSPEDVTYNGLLAYFYDFILHPNRKRVFYPTGIAPGVEAAYLSILSEARIIITGASGHSDWVLRPQIDGIEDVRCRISRQAFERFVLSS